MNIEEVVLGIIFTIIGSWGFMLFCGIVHAQMFSAMPPISYGVSVSIIATLGLAKLAFRDPRTDLD